MTLHSPPTLPPKSDMIVSYTTEREYPYGTLRSTNASKVKIIHR